VLASSLIRQVFLGENLHADANLLLVEQRVYEFTFRTSHSQVANFQRHERVST